MRERLRGYLIGRWLLNELRQTLDGRYEVNVHEYWWGEPGLPFDQPT
jgi:hypothetical protein